MISDLTKLRLDHAHCRAICDEIGDRLREIMARESMEMSPYLRCLVDRLPELDDVPSPSISPWVEELRWSGIREPA